MFDKKKITNCFNRASSSYEENATIQKEAANLLLKMLRKKMSNFYPAKILDIGAGTGVMTDLMAKEFKNSLLLINDISPAMLEQIKNKNLHNQKLTYLLGDMDLSIFPPVDLTVSNFSLQWSSDWQQLLIKLLNRTKVLLFSMLLKGTFKEWSNVFTTAGMIDPVRKYPSALEMTNFFKPLGKNCYFETLSFTLDFINYSTLLYYLRNLGASHSASYLDSNPSKKQELVGFLKKLLKMPPQPILIEYQVMLGVVY